MNKVSRTIVFNGFHFQQEMDILVKIKKKEKKKDYKTSY